MLNMNASSILKKINNYFIPSEENDFQPHSLRFRSIFIIFLIILFLENSFFFLSYYLIPSSTFLANLVLSSIVDHTNQYRSASSLPQLTLNPLLNQAAQLKAEDMAQKGYFSHNSPDNKTPWDWLKQVGYDYLYAGENLALNYSDSEEVVQAWINSESHRQNLLNPHFKEIGIGIAKGTYQNQPAIFIVQFFGTPKNLNLASSEGSKIQPTPQKIQPTATPKIQKTPLSSPILPTKTPMIAAATPNITSAPEIITLTPSSAYNFELNAQSFWASLVSNIVANPKKSLNNLLEYLAIFIILALALKVFVRIDIQYPTLIVNGMIILGVVVLALYLNNYLFSLWPKMI